MWAAPVLETRSSHQLDFQAADGALDAAGNALWLSDPVGKRLVRVQLDPTWSTDVFSVNPMPENLSVSPDGRWLYVTLVKRVHDGNDPSAPLPGAVLEVDLRNPANRVLVDLTIDPMAIAPGGNHRVLVSGLSDSVNRVHRVDFGTLTASAGLVTPFFRALAVHPGEGRAYGAGVQGPDSLCRVDLEAGSLLPVKFTPIGYSPGNIFTRIAMHPDGTRLAINWNELDAITDEPLLELQSINTQSVFTGRPVFDPLHRSLFATGPVQAADGSQTSGLLRLNSVTGARVDGYLLPQAEWFFPMERLLASVASTPGGSVIRFHDNPASGSEANKPAVAKLVVEPQIPMAGAPIRLDASSSTDDEGGLLYAWDFGGYGNWSLPNTSPANEFSSPKHGTQVVGLRVQDRQGEVTDVRGLVNVSAKPEIIATSPFEFGIPIADVGAMTFHPTRPRAYVAERNLPRIVEINLETGFVEREFFATYLISALAVTPDGGWLEMAHAPVKLTSQPRFQSLISEINLVDGTLGNTTPEFTGGPMDLRVVDRHRVVLSTTGAIATFDMTTGHNSGFLAMRFPAHIQLTDDSNHLLAAAEDGQIHRLNLDPVSGVASAGDSWTIPGQQGTWRVFPVRGRHCVTSTGAILELPESSASPLVVLGQVGDGPVRDVWLEPASRATYFVASRAGIQQVSAQSDRLVRTVSPVDASAVAAFGPSLFTLDPEARAMQRNENPAFLAEGNQPPTIRLAELPALPDTVSPIVFDASASSDDRDKTDQLIFRWRIDGPIAYRSEGESTSRLTHRFVVPGHYVLTVEVQDSVGATRSVARAFDVVEALDPGTTTERSVGNIADFDIRDAQFDAALPYLYVIEDSTGNVLRWNLDTGVMDRRWEFGSLGKATTLAISADGRTMFAAIDHNKGTGEFQFWFATLAKFDLERQVKVKEFTALQSITEMAATDAGLVIVAGNGSLGLEIAVFDSLKGVLREERGVLEPRGLAVHPGQHAVYSCEMTDDRTPIIARYDLDPATGKLTRSPSWVNRPNSVRADVGVFALADGNFIVAGQGDVLKSSSDPSVDLTFVENIGSGPITALAVGSVPGDFVAGNTLFGTLQFFSGGGFKPIVEWPSPPPFPLPVYKALSVHGGTVLIASAYGGGIAVSRRQFPAHSAAENRPPTATVVNPVSGDVLSSAIPLVRLSATADDVDGIIRKLVIQVDGEPAIDGGEGRWAHKGRGTYQVTAVAEDNWGARATSAPVTLRVSDPPVVNVTKPSADQVFEAPAQIVFEASASDPDGSIRQVEYYDGTNLLGIATSPPYRVTTGTLTQNLGFRVVVVDNLGLRTERPSTVNFRGPVGDEYLRPFELQGFQAIGRASNREATRQAGEIPAALGQSAGNSVWWRWVAPADGIVTVSTFGSSIDTLLGAYVVSNGSQRVLVASNDDGPLVAPASQIKFMATSGEDYRFVVDAPSGRAGGDVVLGLELETLPAPQSDTAPNNAFAARTILRGQSPSAVADSSLATREANEPSIIAGIPGGASLWWEWTPPAAGIVTISTAGSGFDTLLGVYRGTASLPSFGVDSNRVASNDDDPLGGKQSRLRFYAAANQKLFITVDGFGGGRGPIELQVDLEPQTPASRPANDRFSDRITIPTTNVVMFGSNVGTQYEAAEPLATFHPVWWTWTATETRPVYVSTAGSSIPTILGVYTGSSVGQLTQVSFARPAFLPPSVSRQAVAPFIAIAGQTYQIAVAGETATTPGAIQLQVIPGVRLPDVPVVMQGADSYGTLFLSLGTNGTHTAVILSSTNLPVWRAIGTNRLDASGRFEVQPWRNFHEFIRAVLWD